MRLLEKGSNRALDFGGGGTTLTIPFCHANHYRICDQRRGVHLWISLTGEKVFDHPGVRPFTILKYSDAVFSAMVHVATHEMTGNFPALISCQN